MYLQRLLQINIATMAALGALLLGMGRREVGLALLVCLAAAASVWLTDVRGWFRLNRLAAAIAATVASIVSLRELLRFSGDMQTLAVASLLVYLQIILLFQKKDTRIYWQLIMLSLLEVVIAAAFSQGAWFGLLLIVYMLVGLSALALLLLHGQLDRYSTSQERAARPTSNRRWPLAQRGEVIGGATAGGAASAAGGELFHRLGLIALGTLLLTLLIFFTVPRMGTAQWREPITSARHLVGFSERVTLGELGQIIESPEEVMRVQLSHAESAELYPVHDELYLRGAVLTQYNDQQWASSNVATETPPHAAPVDGPGNDLRHDGVIQRLTVEPLDRDELFCVWPPLGIQSNKMVRIERGRLLRQTSLRGRRIALNLGTTAFFQGRQRSLLSCEEMPEDRPNLKTLLQMPELPKLAALAKQWDSQSNLPESDHRSRALALERGLRDSGRFSYSLQGQSRDPAVDPIEDFISDNPRGHCEYFATALALMLRSRGIPSRVIVGYRCDEFNELGNFHQVRQLHAHAWVEAYLTSQRAWLRLDATPAAALRGDVGQLQKGLNWLQYVWQNYVVEMDGPRQAEAIYQPVADAVRSTANRLRDPDWWRTAWKRVTAALSLDGWTAILWWAVLVVGLAGLAIVAFRVARWMKKLLVRLIARITGRRCESPGKQRSRVEFYHRLEVMLADCGLVRRSGQTQGEFAKAAGSHLARLSGQGCLATLPSGIVDAFYQVRFGHLPLDSTRAEAVEHQLAELASSLKQIPGRHPGNRLAELLTRNRP